MKVATFRGVEGNVLDIQRAVRVLRRYETRTRVRCALRECECDWAPSAADIPDPYLFQGRFGVSGMDLALALWIAGRPFDGLVVGELSLDGHVRPVRGLIVMLRAAQRAGVARALVPVCQWRYARLVEGIEIVPTEHLRDALAKEPPAVEAPPPATSSPPLAELPRQLRTALDAVVSAIERGRPVLLVGPLGSGKTAVTRRIVQRLPSMNREEMLDVLAIRSSAGLPLSTVADRPFRAPHHTISAAAALGHGGRLGEVHLAHKGVLLLDECSEFRPDVLEGVRKAFCDRQAHGAPASFALIMARALCPCGFAGGARRRCACTPRARQRWDARTSRTDLGADVVCLVGTGDRCGQLADVSEEGR